jgi:hypothetical protein
VNAKDTLGVYCLGNDGVLDWMIAFLESFRSFEPTRELIVIPFDDNTEKLSRLSDRYDFQFLADDALEELDQIAAEVKPGARVSRYHNWRKLAAFWGPLDHFLYLDADIVVLGNLDQLFSAFLTERCDFIYFDVNIDMAYNPGAFRERMIEEYATAGFNAGAFVSTKGIFSMEEIRVLARKAAPLSGDFQSSGDQSFLNYIVDIRRLNKRRYCHLEPSASCSNWASLAPIGFSDGSYRLYNAKHNDKGKTLAFLHWAGFKQGPLMPHRRIFLHFRHKGKPWIRRFAHCYILEPFRLLSAVFLAAVHKVCCTLRRA